MMEQPDGPGVTVRRSLYLKPTSVFVCVCVCVCESWQGKVTSRVARVPNKSDYYPHLSSQGLSGPSSRPIDTQNIW
jgi:hypothetical protein